MSDNFGIYGGVFSGLLGQDSSGNSKFKKHVEREKQINSAIDTAGEDDVDDYEEDTVSEDLVEWNARYVYSLTERLETLYKFDKSNLQSMLLNLDAYKNAFEMAQGLRTEYSSVYRNLAFMVSQLVEEDITKDVAMKVADKYKDTMLSFVEARSSLTESFSQTLFDRGYQNIRKLTNVQWDDETGLPNVDVSTFKWTEYKDSIAKLNFSDWELQERVNGQSPVEWGNSELVKSLVGVPKDEIMKRVGVYRKYEDLYLKLISDYDKVISWSWDAMKELGTNLFTNMLTQETKEEVAKLSQELAEDWYESYQDWMEKSVNSTIQLIQVNIIDTLSMIKSMHQQELENAFNAGSDV